MRRLLILATFLLLAYSSAFSQISTDAGLTPAQDRWIFRTQYRAMGMENSMMKMNTQMVPVVLGYGHLGRKYYGKSNVHASILQQ